ncbi:MAG TPA: accessory factor UbiK family protein [Gammaproteobacteria bacterium]|nr:accessory factor UbiK family protein [Gammaproteobacteria bacterium]
MIKNDNLDSMIDRIMAGLPASLTTLGREAEQNIRAAVKSALRKMDLVTREEFDIQHEVLIRTRSRLEALEKQVAKLENKETGE